MSWARAAAGDADPPVGQQPGAGRLPGGQVGGERGLVRGGPVRGNDPDGDARGPGAERRQDRRRPGQVEAGTEQRPDGGRLDDHGGVAGIGRDRPEHEQVAPRGTRVPRAPRTSPDRRTPSRPGLTCWATQAAASARTAASWRAGAALGGPLPRVPVRCRTATTDSDPRTRAGITIRAASPAPSQLADSGSASGCGASGDLPAVPSHSVTSSSVTGPALAARGGSCVASVTGPPHADARR